jgi:hypothetical protein
MNQIDFQKKVIREEYALLDKKEQKQFKPTIVRVVVSRKNRFRESVK